MADEADEGGEGHDKGAGAHGAFQVVAQEGGEHHQHHHAAAGAHKAGAKADGQAKEQGDDDLLHAQSDAGGVRPRLGGVRLEQEPDADAEGQHQREAPQHHVAHQIGGVAAHGAQGDDADQHDPAVFQVDVLVPGVDRGGDGRAEDVRGQGNGRGLIRPVLPGEGGAEDDQNRHHHRGRRQARQPRSNSRAQRRDDVPKVFHRWPSVCCVCGEPLRRGLRRATDHAKHGGGVSLELRLYLRRKKSVCYYYILISCFLQGFERQTPVIRPAKGANRRIFRPKGTIFLFCPKTRRFGPNVPFFDYFPRLYRVFFPCFRYNRNTKQMRHSEAG